MIRSSQRASWPWLVALIGLALYAGSAALTPISNNDVWIHLTTGRLVLEEGAVPTQDRYSFTAAGNRYVAHEWLAATVYAAGERVGGIPGVIVVAKLLPTLALVAALLVAAAAAGARVDAALLLGVLGITVARHRIVARPELLALVLVLLTLAILWRDRRRGGGRPGRGVLALIPLQILWVNVHGSFPLGPGLVLLFAAVEAGNDLLDRDGSRARALRGILVATAAGVSVWIATLEPPAFGRPAAMVLAVGAALLALDGSFGFFRDAGTGSIRRAAWLLSLAGAMVLACIVSPHGTGIFLFPFEFTTGTSLVTSRVLEWRPLLDSPSLVSSLALPAYLAFLGVASCAFGMASWAGKLRRLDLALLLALAVLPLRHARWMALATLGLIPTVASLLGRREGSPPSAGTPHRILAAVFGLLGASLLGSAGLLAARTGDTLLIGTLAVGSSCGLLALVTTLPRSDRWWKPGWAAGVLGSVALAALATVHGIPEIAGIPRRPGLGVSPQEPTGAVAFMARHDIRGRLFTEYEWAGYAIHQLWPSVTVFIDSRSEVYPEALLIEYEAMMRSRRAAIRGLETHDADLVLVRHIPFPGKSPRSRGILRALELSPEWGLLYLDDRSFLYGRSWEDRRLPQAYALIEPRRLRPGDSRVSDPEFEAEVRRALGEAPESAALHWALASAHHAGGKRSEALTELERAWVANPFYPAVAQLAGELTREMGDLETARRWFQRAQGVAPGWEAPRRALKELGSR